METKKLGELKDLVEDNEVFKSLRKNLDEYKGIQGPRLLKADMLEIIEKGKSSAPVKADKGKSSTRSLVKDGKTGSVKKTAGKKEKKSLFVIKYARPLAVVVALFSGETNKEKLIQKALEYVKTSSAVADEKETKYFFSKVFACLIAEGLAEETETDFVCKFRHKKG